ncbi:HAD family hydrolase [Hymenobacter terrenus]|uniref:HAD family hydrolase n=1 Tax=Hymenobacter terrenus TaxID=1629124 RepID=UPI000907EDE9|nr:HAD family hydrolase [Hymenobacter terrenus]
MRPPLSVRTTTVLFDLDDTLFDHTATSRAALAASTAALPQLQQVAFEPLYQRCSELLEELHLQVLSGRYTPQEARLLRFQRLVASYQIAATDAEIDQFIHLQQTHYHRLHRPVTGAVALLKALKPQYRIGIVTNNHTLEQEDKLRFLGMDRLVDALITSEEVGVAKPDPRIFQVALQRLDSLPEETALVGDNWHVDVVGALGVGIRPLWLNRFGAPRPLALVEEVSSFEPLASVMQTIAGSRQTV